MPLTPFIHLFLTPLCHASKNIMKALTHFTPLVSLYPGKHKKTSGFLIFSWGVKRDQWHKIGRWGLHKILLRHAKAAGEKLDTIFCLSLKWVSIINSEVDCVTIWKNQNFYQNQKIIKFSNVCSSKYAP